MKIKEILAMNAEELEKIMTEEEYNKMRKIGIDETWKLLDMLQDSARLSGQSDDEEHITISAYLEYLEDMKD